MRCLGIVIKKNEIWYAVVDGMQMNDALIYETGKHHYRAESSTLMMDFSNIFTELVTKYRPQKIVYKLSLDVTLPQIPYMHFPLGVLHLICLQHGISVDSRSSKWITAGKRAKITKCQDYFNQQRLRPDELAATLIAWYGLEE